jgi:hypothetical protein
MKSLVGWWIAVACCIALTGIASADDSTGYDIFLLAGQSNMAGRGRVPTPIDVDGQPSTAIKMWDPARGIVAASDPLLHPEAGSKPTAVGPAMSFAKSYVAYLNDVGYPNRRVLLVGAAWGGTSFVEDVAQLHRRWIATSDPAVGGDLYRTAVSRANAAITAAVAQAPGSQFKGILWHQGESDLVRGGAGAYAANHKALMIALRSKITGAASAPIVVGEMTPCFWSQCESSVRTVSQGDRDLFLRYLHRITIELGKAAWVSSAGLQGNEAGDQIHFNTASQRELGRRYFAKYWEASHALPSPVIELKSYDGKLFNVGSAIDFDARYNTDAQSVREDGNVAITGGVQLVNDSARGNVVKIDNSAGQLRLLVDANLFGASYTKMAWIKLRSANYRNHLLSGDNASQSHSLYTSLPSKHWSAGHSTATNRNNIFVSQPIIAALDVWTQVAVTYDAAGQSMRFYVNGVLSSTQLAVPPASTSTAPTTLNMSGFGSRNDYGIDGQMISNRVYTQALSSAQIQAMFTFERNSQTGYGVR